MSPTKEMLHSLIDNVKTSEYDLIFRILLKCIEEVEPYEDEIEALEYAKLHGEYIAHEDIDWDNLDSMDLD